MRVFSGLILAAMTLWGQGTVSGPTPGYIFDREARELRPLRGTPGMSHLGAALVTDAGAVSVSRDGTLAAASRFGTLEVIRGFDSSSPARTVLASEAGEVLFAWSGHDLAAVFPATRKVMVWRNAEGAPTEGLAMVDGEIGTVLLDGLPDGNTLIVAARGGLYAVKNGETRRIAAMDDPSSIVLAGRDLFAADRATNQVLRIRDYAAAAVAERFAEVGQPVGLQLAGRTLLVASAQSRTVEVFDVASQMRTASVELDFLPTRMQPIGSGALALLNQGSSSEPLYVLDTKNSPQVYFVPTGLPAGREQ